MNFNFIYIIFNSNVYLDKDLKGPIPAELGDLPYLQILY